MRERRVVGIILLLTILVSVSLVFGLGVVDISKLGSSPPVQPASPGTTVFVDPDAIIKDYLLDPGYQIGDTFSVHINVSEATDLFAWQVNITWNTAVLNLTGIASYGDFLARTASPDGTSSIYDILDSSNETGYAAIAESILGDYPGITGNGRLVTIGFEIVGYGCSDFTINTGGLLPTTLLDSAGNSMAFATVDGWFKNKLAGDSNGDGLVSAADAGTLSDYWTGPPPGLYPYSRCIDQVDDGKITAADAGIVSDNWLRSVVLP